LTAIKNGGAGTLSRPLLMAMQLSPVSKTQSSMRTSQQFLGLHPSLFVLSDRIVMPRTVTLVLRIGWITHMGDWRIVTPSIKTLEQRWVWTKFGRRKWPSPNTRSSTEVLT
jgi:hypothetical protein